MNKIPLTKEILSSASARGNEFPCTGFWKHIPTDEIIFVWHGGGGMGDDGSLAGIYMGKINEKGKLERDLTKDYKYERESEASKTISKIEMSGYACGKKEDVKLVSEFELLEIA